MERDPVYVSRGEWGEEGEGAGERDSVRETGRVTERKKVRREKMAEMAERGVAGLACSARKRVGDETKAP